MNESLQSARNIHQILIIVCTAIFIFSLSLTEQQNKYQVGLDELASLDELLNDTEASLRKEPTLYDSLNILYRTDLPKADSLLQKLKRSDLSEIRDFLNSSWNSAHGRYADGKILAAFMIEHFSYYGLTNGQKYANQSLPMLAAVWDNVRYETIEDSKKQLKAEAREFSKKPESDLDIAGFRINGKNLYLIAPFITIAILIYLSTLINHIQSLLKNDKDNENDNIKTIKYFPWMALFPTLKSQMLNVITFAIFPSATCYAILARSPLSEFQTNCWFVAYAVLSSIFSVQIFMRALHIQDRVHYNGEFFAKKKASTKTVESHEPEKEK